MRSLGRPALAPPRAVLWLEQKLGLAAVPVSELGLVQALVHETVPEQAPEPELVQKQEQEARPPRPVQPASS